MVTNASDTTVNNDVVYEVTGNWRAHGANLTTFEFGAELHLGHDLIDPAQEDQQVDIVYPQLMALILR